MYITHTNTGTRERGHKWKVKTLLKKPVSLLRGGLIPKFHTLYYFTLVKTHKENIGMLSGNYIIVSFLGMISAF